MNFAVKPVRLLLGMLAVLLLSVGLTVGPAKASSPACLAVGPGCGSEVNLADGFGWVPKGGTASNNNPVNAYPNGGGNADDWLRTQPVSSTYYRFEYAPNGAGTGYCASDPGSPDAVVLRACNTMDWQEFSVGTGNTLVDKATGLKVKDNGQSVQLTATSTATTAWTWQGGTGGGGGGGGGMTAPPGFTTKIFEDQFTGTTLDSSKWVTYVGDRGIRWDNHGALPSPYSGFNQPGASGQAMYAPSQVTVNNGLTFTAQRNNSSSACGSPCAAYASSYGWVSGTVNTEGKFTLPTTSSWYVQANIKMPDTSQGMWPAMWSLCAVTCSPENELDMWEGGFHELSGVPANNTGHWDYFSNAGQKANEADVGFDTSAGYHVYGVKFVPNTSITWYLDGVQKHQVSTATCGCTIPAEPYELMLNLQVAADSTSGYHTITNANTPSTTMQVAEVQAYTP